MRNAHSELPSAASAVRSRGVVTRNKGALAAAEGVSRRTAWFSVAVGTDVELKGKGNVWAGVSEREERICTIEVGYVGATRETPDSFVLGAGTVPGGRTENT